MFAVYGTMGAGKTTFIKALCTELGSVDTVTSPPSPGKRVYDNLREELIYHFDFYRIKKKEEIFDFGFEEYMSSVTTASWNGPELVEEILPPGIIKVQNLRNPHDNHARMVEVG
ncbi:MAG: tRNA (adenosine(37)-N6)-threonylcarbamoyltransferase complex ATPase subunit type 1 TsaE [Bacteroidales bacterium]